MKGTEREGDRDREVISPLQASQSYHVNHTCPDHRPDQDAQGQSK
jgi:hypothetical protein